MKILRRKGDFPVCLKVSLTGLMNRQPKRIDTAEMAVKIISICTGF